MKPATFNKQPSTNSRSRPRSLPRCLTDAQNSALLAAIHGKFSGRDRLILQVGLFAGLRVSEIHHLRIHHLNLADATAQILNSKYGRDRTVPLHEKLVAELKHYLGRRIFSDPCGPVFLSRQNRPIHPRTIQYMLKKACQKLGWISQPKTLHSQRSATPHTLRHTAATRLLRAGATLRVVQEFLGHASPVTTMRYTHVTIPELKTAADKLPWYSQENSQPSLL